jgi:ABC-2 type transport system ATP-binding protein
MDLLREERAAGRTVFLSSHNLSEVERVCDRVGIIREGRMVALEGVDVLKASRVRQMSILFRNAVDPRAFEIDGVVVLDRGERRLKLAVRGDINPLIRLLARHDIQDLSFSEPDLEDVFLHYYQDTAKAQPA